MAAVLVLLGCSDDNEGWYNYSPDSPPSTEATTTTDPVVLIPPATISRAEP